MADRGYFCGAVVLLVADVLGYSADIVGDCVFVGWIVGGSPERKHFSGEFNKKQLGDRTHS